MHQLIIFLVVTEGHFTHWKSVRDFFRTKGFMRIFDAFFLRIKRFLPKGYEIFGSEMPLGGYCFELNAGLKPKLPAEK